VAKQWGPQLRVLKRGEAGRATVLGRSELDTTTTGGGSHTPRRIQYHGSLVREVERAGNAPYRALCKQWFDSATWSFVAQRIDGARSIFTSGQPFCVN